MLLGNSQKKPVKPGAQMHRIPPPVTLMHTPPFWQLFVEQSVIPPVVLLVVALFAPPALSKKRLVEKRVIVNCLIFHTVLIIA